MRRQDGLQINPMTTEGKAEGDTEKFNSVLEKLLKQAYRRVSSSWLSCLNLLCKILICSSETENNSETQSTCIRVIFTVCLLTV